MQSLTPRRDPRCRGGLRAARSEGRVVLLESKRVRVDQQLSSREVEVLRLVAAGLANKQIARRLGIAERTVKAHLTNIFARIDVTDRTQAALWAERNLPPVVGP